MNTVSVLIIDDSSFARRMLSAALKELGYEVIAAESGSEGIKRAVEQKPDILITDLLMPGHDGFWVLDQLKSLNLKVSTIIFTSDVQTTTKERCLRMGADAFLTKPLKKEELDTAIRNALARGKR